MLSNVSMFAFMEPRNRFQEMNSSSLCRLADRYDNPIPTLFLAPIDCLKIPAQDTDDSHQGQGRSLLVMTWDCMGMLVTWF
jgi:hypothetical protein